MGSPSAAGNGDKTFAFLLVFFMILLHTAWGSTIPFMVTSFLTISITTPSTPAFSKETALAKMHTKLQTCKWKREGEKGKTSKSHDGPLNLLRTSHTMQVYKQHKGRWWFWLFLLLCLLFFLLLCFLSCFLLCFLLWLSLCLSLFLSKENQEEQPISITANASSGMEWMFHK